MQKISRAAAIKIARQTIDRAEQERLPDNRIWIWVYFKCHGGEPGCPEEGELQMIAEQHGGKWTGQGTALEEHERDNSFEFQNDSQCWPFMREVAAMFSKKNLQARFSVQFVGS